MTIIAWDGHTLATDSEITTQGRKDYGEKAWYSKDHTGKCILSGIGNFTAIAVACEWYKNRVGGDGTPLHEVLVQLNRSEGATFIVVNSDGLRYYMQPWRGHFVGNKPCAFGIGSDFAYGALHVGASAQTAVEVAIKYSIHCGGEIRTYKI